MFAIQSEYLYANPKTITVESIQYTVYKCD